MTDEKAIEILKGMRDALISKSSFQTETKMALNKAITAIEYKRDHENDLADTLNMQDKVDTLAKVVENITDIMKDMNQHHHDSMNNTIIMLESIFMRLDALEQRVGRDSDSHSEL